MGTITDMYGAFFADIFRNITINHELITIFRAKM